jgi:hypothetical protein
VIEVLGFFKSQTKKSNCVVIILIEIYYVLFISNDVYGVQHKYFFQRKPKKVSSIVAYPLSTVRVNNSDTKFTEAEN